MDIYKQTDIIRHKVKRIHLVGIGGSGMSGIAEVLINMGYKVSGSDIKRSDLTEKLKKIGAKIYYSHSSRNVKNTDIVVYSSAIDKNNPEIIQAKKLKIPILQRAEMLFELSRLKHTITVAGTHGKTTTASLIGFVLQTCGLDPTVIIGGILKNYGSGARMGKGDFFVMEADESDNSFLKLTPTITVVTNIDNDHLDYHKTMENLIASFVEHINKLPFYGLAILCYDDHNIRNMIPKITKRVLTYSLNSYADIYPISISKMRNGYSYDVVVNKKQIKGFTLNLAGIHNVLNSLAAIGIALELRLDINKIREAIKNFKGVKRRIEIKGEFNGIKVIDDYAHHPTEINTTLKTIKEFYNPQKIVVIFQPHRYTRTQLLYNEFGKAFKYADEIHLMEIYPAGEKEIPNITSQLIFDSLKNNKKRVFMFENTKKALENVKSGDVIVTLGAGDVWKVAEEIVRNYQRDVVT